jgi:hypothetical protein
MVGLVANAWMAQSPTIDLFGIVLTRRDFVMWATIGALLLCGIGLPAIKILQSRRLRQRRAT